MKFELFLDGRLFGKYESREDADTAIQAEQNSSQCRTIHISRFQIKTAQTVLGAKGGFDAK